MAQRCHLLALNHTSLNSFQEEQAAHILNMNIAIVELLGLSVPGMKELEQMSLEYKELERRHGIQEES